MKATDVIGTRRVVFSFVAGIFASVAMAANVCTWTGKGGDGKWSTSKNWENEVKPVSGDKVIISSAGLMPGADGFAVMENDISKNFGICPLEIADGSGALRLEGLALSLQGIPSHGVGITGKPAPDNATILCLAQNVPVELACELYSTGQRALWLGENANLTISGKMTGNTTGNLLTYLQKGGAPSSTFTLAADITYPGLIAATVTDTNVLGATVALRSGTNVISGAAVSTVSRKDTRIVIGTDTNESCPTVVSFGAGTYESKFSLQGLTNKKKHTFVFDGDCTFKDDFASTGASGSFVFASAPLAQVRFEKDLVLPGAASYIDLSDGAEIAVDGRFVSKELWDLDRASGDAAVNNLRLNGSAEVNQFYTRYYNVIFGNDSVFTSRPLLKWGSSSSDIRGVYDLNGHDQVIGGFECPNLQTASWGGRLIKSDEPATLIVEDTADRVSKSFIKGQVTLVYDPADFHRLTLSNNAFTATGDLIVSNGAVRLVDGASYANANEIRVCSGAAFELDTASAGSIGHVKKVVVEAGGAFRLLSERVDPFGSAQPEIDLASGATLDVIGEVPLNALNLIVDGVRPLSGRYQSLDGTDATATKVQWVGGTGVLGLNSGSTSWKTAADGNWAVSDNWSNGLPGAGKGAIVSVEGGDYTVTVDTDPGAQSAITVMNSGIGTATVAVKAPLTMRDGFLLLYGGARFALGAGGGLFFDHDTAMPYDFTEYTRERVRIEGGAELTVGNGRSVIFTNFIGRLVAQGKPDNPARITVDGGAFTFHTAASVDPRMILGKDSLLAVTNGGTFHVDSSNNGYSYPPFLQEGGTIDVSGNSTFLTGRAKTRYFSTGTATFRDNALLNVDPALAAAKIYPDIYIGPRYDCETSTVVFTDHARYYTEKYSSILRFVVGDDSPMTDEPQIMNGLAVLRYESDAATRFNSYVSVGGDYCRGELYLNAGSMSVTYHNLAIGGGTVGFRRQRTDAHGEGLLSIDGGTFTVSSQEGQGNPRAQLEGVIVGDGSDVKLDGHSFYRGKVELKSGSLINDANSATFVVGAGWARGEIVQIGGTLSHNRHEAWNSMAIGFAGGEGSYVISNGTATIKSDLYVGGVLPDVLHYALPSCPDNQHDATGILAVRGGTVNVFSNLVVSADGAGTLEIGGTGRLLVGGDLELSSCAESACVSTLRYRFGADGIGSMSVGGTIRIANGTRLVVDMSDYVGKLRGFRVMDLTGAEGTFADVEFIKPSIVGGENMTLVVDGNGVRVKSNRGVVLIVR